MDAWLVEKGIVSKWKLQEWGGGGPGQEGYKQDLRSLIVAIVITYKKVKLHHAFWSIIFNFKWGKKNKIVHMFGCAQATKRPKFEPIKF
jgi:hypothetical protein